MSIFFTALWEITSQTSVSLSPFLVMMETNTREAYLKVPTLPMRLCFPVKAEY